MLRKHVVMKHFGMNNEIKIRVNMVIRNGPTAEVKKNKDFFLLRH